MIRYEVEISGENPGLARAEVRGAGEALGGVIPVGPAEEEDARLAPLLLPDDDRARALAGRLAMAWRVLRPWPIGPEDEVEARFRAEGRPGRSAAVRPLGTPSGSAGDLGRFGGAYRSGGGRIDLERPERRFFVARRADGAWWVAEEVAAIDRRAYDARRLPHLPFRRPVSLSPRLGRVLVNLARVRAGDRVVDPFLGTGALMIEAALLGARVSGVDRDAAMVRGAMRNFAHLGLGIERAEVGDAADAAGAGSVPFDAVVTDPPYGRSSGSGGEPIAELLARTLPAWASRVRPGGHVACVLPAGGIELGPDWATIAAESDRVHRSLTREFRAFRRRSAVQ